MRIRKIDTQIEKRIITGAILSKRFLQEIIPFTDLVYFHNNYAKTIMKCCIEFFKKYDTSPYTDIRSSILREMSTQENDVIIDKILSEIFEQHKTRDGLNIDRLLDQTTEYFKKREIEITNGNIAVLLERDDVLEAERELLSFRKISRVTSNWENPFKSENIEKTFRKEEEMFFMFPGDLGKFLGNIKRGWFVGVSGPFKRGKTWTQLEFAVMGVMLGLRVAFLSLEMSEEEMFGRIYKRVVPYLLEGTLSLYPCFDCKMNQTGLCRKPNRTSKVSLFERPNDDKLPDFYKAKERGYMPCSYCRFDEPDLYEKTTWFQEIKIPEFNREKVESRLMAFNDYYGHLLRVKDYPKYSANVSDIERDLDILELSEDFTPDIIIVDHADILKPERESGGIEKEDQTWMSLARMAGERKALVVTGTQLTKDSLDAIDIKQKHTARWIGKLGHVDMMLSLNQTEEEKRMGVMRIGVMVHRHKDFYESDKVTLLQNLSLAQVHLDSQC